MRRRVVLWTCLVALVIAAVEVVSALGALVLWHRRQMPRFGRLTDAEVAGLLRGGSRELGWISNDGVPEPGFSSPARPDPAFAGGAPCATVYGESFAYGTPVGDDATFPHHLALRLGCSVTNFGVPGYGTDQAFLLQRAQRDVDPAPVVLLVHVAENLLRNVNQYRELLYPGSVLAFKPRLRVDERGRLRRVPIPVRHVADYRAMERSPERVLAWDAFASRPRCEAPFTPKLVRWFLGGYLLRERLFDEPWHLAYYRPDHPAGGLDVTATILETFARDVGRRGRRPLVVLLPTSLDLLHRRRTGRWATEPLTRRLIASGVPLLDVGPVLLARLDGRDPTTLFDGGRSGHLTPEGYRWLADAVGDGLAGR